MSQKKQFTKLTVRGILSPSTYLKVGRFCGAPVAVLSHEVSRGGVEAEGELDQPRGGGRIGRHRRRRLRAERPQHRPLQL